MPLNHTYAFSHDRVTATYFLLAIISSIAITAVPLVTAPYLDTGNSFILMFLIEFLASTLIYAFLLHNFPECRFKVAINSKLLRKTLFSFLIIILIQVFHCALNKPSHYYEAAQPSIISVVIVIIIVPFYEEIFYRGCLFGLACSVYNKSTILPSIVTSLIFVLIHSQYHSIIDKSVVFFAAMTFTYIRIKTKGLFYPIVLHSGMNAVVIFLNTQKF